MNQCPYVIRNPEMLRQARAENARRRWEHVTTEERSELMRQAVLKRWAAKRETDSAA